LKLFIEIAISPYQPQAKSVVNGFLYCQGNFLATEITLLKNLLHNHNYTDSKELS